MFRRSTYVYSLQSQEHQTQPHRALVYCYDRTDSDCCDGLPSRPRHVLRSTRDWLTATTVRGHVWSNYIYSRANATNMTDFAGVWSEDEVAAFLQEVTIPIRIATRRSDGSLWPVTVWYQYRDGVFECATQAAADLVHILENDPTVGIDVSTNDPPYSGVRGTGTATLSRDGGEEVLRDLVQRYLDGTDSSLAQRLLGGDREEALIRIDPDEIYSWDYSNRMKDVD
jgi:hypothetical protein